MGKHAIERENKSIKIIGLLILIIVIISIIVAVINNNNSSKLEETIDKAFMALKTYNINETNKYIDYEKVLYSLDEILVDEKNENVEKELFNSIEWKIDKIDINGDTATAVIELTNKNFVTVVTNWMKIIVAEKDKGKKITNKSSLAHLEKVLSETQETKTEINKINLKKENNVWKIEVTEEFRNLVYPGVDIVSSVLENDIIK